MNLTIHAQDIHVENYTTLMKESKMMKDKKKIERYTVFMDWYTQHGINMSTLPTIIHRFNTIPLKIPAAFFVDTENNILKFI